MKFAIISSFWIISLCFIYRAASEFGSNIVHSVDHQSTKEVQKNVTTSKLSCFMCRVASEFMMNAYLTDTSEECIEAISIQFCVFFKIEDTMVCNSIIKLFKEEILYIFGHLVLSPDQLCGLLMPDSCGNPYIPAYSDWNVTFPDTPKPHVPEPFLPKKDAPKLRVLHLTDIHFDKLYKVGSNVHCLDPLCCRYYETSDNSSYLPAGQWGSPSGKCDIPIWTLENLFIHLNTSENFDYILWTGDLPAHNVWNQTRDDQLSAYQTLMDLFLKYFPNKIIYSAVGNHESSPVDSFPPHYKNLPQKFSIGWLYDALSEHWTHWINKTQSSNIRKLASYVVRPFPGFRIISLNTNYCWITNFWIYLNETDPDNELAWLIEQLQIAEDVGDKVHIIGHVLPGQCLSQWSKNYYDIINRYEDTVRAQFFGHTHGDEFAVFYESANYTHRATNMYYVGPSITTYPTKSDMNAANPAYRVYIIDGNYSNSTWRVLNHETYFLNLTEANISNTTKWQLEYDAKNAYNLKTLFSQEWSDFILRMKQNDTLFQLYNTYYNRQATNCDESCKRDKICYTRSADSYHKHLCDDLPKPNATKVDDLLWMKTFFMKLPERSFLPKIPTKCIPHFGGKNESTTKSFLANKSVCWLLFPSSNSSRNCRNLCEVISKSKNGRNKLSIIKELLCNLSSQCCIQD